MSSLNRRFNPKIAYLSFSVPYFSIKVFDYFLSAYIGLNLNLFGIPFQLISSFIILIRLSTTLMQPLLGYFSDRNYFFTRKVGRRFLWIILTGVLVPLFYILSFLPLFFNNYTLSFYISMIFLFYITFSLLSMSYSALLINKFRTSKERLIIASLTEFLSNIGFIVLVVIVPYIINDFFFVLVIIPASVFLISVLFGAPGILEERDLIDTYFSPNQKSQEWFLKDFFKRFYLTFHQKNFILLLVRWIAFSVVNFLFLRMFYWYIHDILNLSYFLLFFPLGAYYIFYCVAIPISLFLSRICSYLKIWLISGFAMLIIIVI